MSRTVFGSLFFIVWILESSVTYSSPVTPVVIPTSNNLSSFMSLFPMKSQEAKLTPSKVAQSCPQLWADNSVDFLVEEPSGKLGSLDELDKQCYSKENMSLLCQGAIRISSYLCDASSSGFTTKKWPEPPTINDALALRNQTELCNEIANPDLLNNLCRIVKKPMADSPTDQNCGPQDTIRHICSNLCFEENNRLCQMILQGFKTVIYWESLKNAGIPDASGVEDLNTNQLLAPDNTFPESSGEVKVSDASISGKQDFIVNFIE